MRSIASPISKAMRNTIIARMTDAFAQSNVPFLDMAANQGLVGQKISETLGPVFADLVSAWIPLSLKISRCPKS